MRDLLERFNEHLSYVKRNNGLYVEDLYRAQAEEGKAINLLLANQLDKSNYISFLKELDAGLEIQKRMFLVNTPDELEEVLYYYTQNRESSRKYRLKIVEERAKLIRSFNPVYDNEPLPSVIFGVFLTDDPYIVPYTISCMRFSGLTPLRSYVENMYALFEAWSIDTIKDFWRYLEQGVPVNDRSDGEHLLFKVRR